MKNFLQSPSATRIAYIIGIVLAALVIFQTGVAFGYHRALFYSHRSDNYSRSFDDPRSMFAPFRHMSDEPNPNGAIGSIISAHLPLLMIKGTGSAEEVVIIATSTTIRQLSGPATTVDLVAGKQVIVIGSPNDQGQIVASFVRILPGAINESSSTTLR